MFDYLMQHPAVDVFPWHLFLSLLSILLGASVGSFLNVCIHRIPREMSIVTPRSHCPRCGKMIPWYYNLPLFSYIFLKGKCGFCEGKISARYFTVELITALLFFAVWLKFVPEGKTPPIGLVPVHHIALVPIYWLFFSSLILGTFVDFEHLIIPDRVTLGGILAGLALSAVFPLMHGETEIMRSLLWSSLGALLGWGSLWIIAVLGEFLLKKEAMGFGDVKLLGAIGAFLGSKAVFFTIFLSSLSGSIVGISLVVLGKKKMQSKIPYGPYIALAAIIWVLWGQALWNKYSNILSMTNAY